MGTPEFALPTLERLAERYHVVGVVTQPDRRSGRGRHVTVPPVKELAVAEGIPVFQPKRLRNDAEAAAQLRAWSPDVAVVAAYGQILPASVLEIPPLGFLNVHASLLPRWRGASPVQGALLAGDDVTGVTIMKLDEGLDTGPVLAMRETGIGPEETAGDLEARLAEMGADLLMEVLPGYLSGELTPQPQPEEGATITRRIKTSEAQLDWTAPAAVLHNHVRAFCPEPGAYTFWDGVRLKVLRSEVVEPEELPEAEPGTVFLWKDMPAVVTGDGCLALVYVQLAGKRPMDGGAFVRGRQDFVGAQLGSQEPGE
ncbi:MAG: methionyl-tRNA formyltransferase [Anaerolineae bacterium]|nr:methionyl-tRNA formyltransferase [Anaerolineae bacterium]